MLRNAMDIDAKQWPGRPKTAAYGLDFRAAARSAGQHVACRHRSAEENPLKTR
jgi:hypothetical protein